MSLEGKIKKNYSNVIFTFMGAAMFTKIFIEPMISPGENLNNNFEKTFDLSFITSGIIGFLLLIHSIPLISDKHFSAAVPILLLAVAIFTQLYYYGINKTVLTTAKLPESIKNFDTSLKWLLILVIFLLKSNIDKPDSAMGVLLTIFGLIYSIIVGIICTILIFYLTEG